MMTVMIICIIIVFFILFLTLLTTNKAYKYEHTVDEIEEFSENNNSPDRS
ncbi:MAG: YtzI protein [Bacillaceae bacterium]|nr:YtzI protein [Bacillaceae bacterium]